MGHTKTTRRRETDTARERAAAMRAAQAHRERRRRLFVIGGSTSGVVAVVAVIAVVAAMSGGSKKTLPDRSPAPAAVVAAVSGVSTATLDRIGIGDSSAPTTVSDAALKANGKPQVLYVGAEYCPYCAAGRWALVQALSRFGSFSDLNLTHSGSAPEAFPETPSFTFHGASYSSDTIAFTGRELATRRNAPLDTLTNDENALWHRYTGARGSFPFLDIGGRYVEVGQSVKPSVLQGLTAEQIANRLDNPSDPVAKAVDGSANLLTAAICRVTGNAPSAVCSASAVVAAGKALGG